jgi:hypothetical protein
MPGIGISISKFIRGVCAAAVPIPVDPDAQTYITNAGITNPVEANVANFIVRSLKGSDTSFNPGGVNLWTDVKALWPFMGSSANAHKLNIKNPLNTDAAFRIGFTGTWVHTAAGSAGPGDGLVSNLANTFFNPSVQLPITGYSWGTYFGDFYGTLAESENWFIGCIQRTGDTPAFYYFFNSPFDLYPDGYTLDIGSGSFDNGAFWSNGEAPTVTSKGFITIRRDAINNMVVRWNKAATTNLVDPQGDTTANPNKNFYLSGVDDDGTIYGAHACFMQCAYFAQFGDAARVALIENIIQQAQVMLGREQF